MNATIEPKVRKHGEQLLAIFPNATERDPVKLCQKLRRLEAKGQALGLRLCNGPEWESEGDPERISNDILNAANRLLGNATLHAPVQIILNLDPRGYALKIDDEYMRAHNLELHRDWGEYGIIAPDLREAINDM